MPFPIAHGMIGASIVAASRKNVSLSRDWQSLLMGAALANCPDFDFFFVWVLDLSDTWHRGFSHSITFAVIAGLIASALAGRPRLKDILVYGAAAMSHSLLDALSSRMSPGVQLFWPFSSDYYRSGLFEYVDMYLTRYPWQEFLVGAIKVSLIEAVVFAPLLLLTLFINRSRQPSEFGSPARETAGD